ncbi:DUF4352 domain-containing protein [Streptomyces sp. NPDC001868]|uniref:DUF4352 domain-containing protein n=1 Tax=Streptomyces sp. NPDC001868 TaxID=3154401 RepID=UPI00332B02FE
MSHQYPQQSGPGVPQHPGWGGPQQQPGWGGPPPQPPKKTPVGMIVGLGCLGVVVLFVLIGVFGAVAGGGSTAGDDGKGGSAGSDGGVKGDRAEKGDVAAQEEEPAEEAAPESPVKVSAEKAAFSASVLADGSDYTSVKVTITNDGDETISVNPLYFTITDTDGTKHASELAVDQNQIDTVDLAPGENVSGSITGKGTFTPKYVTYTDGLIGDPLRGNVS